jgi:hypothetical protein
LLWHNKSLRKPIGMSCALYKQVYFMYSLGQHSFIILIYVIFGQPGEWKDTKVQIEAPLSENMDMSSAIHRAFLGIFPKITTFMATFLGQPVRRSSRLVISFYGTIWKAEYFRQVWQTYQIPNSEFLKKEVPHHLCPLVESDINTVHQSITLDGQHLTGAILRVTAL